MRSAARKFLCAGLPGLLLAAMPVLPAQAAVVVIASSPLYNSTTTLVKPNVLFLLDDSSSMDYNFLPDEVPRDVTLLGSPNPQTDSHVAALTSSQCSGVAYNPTFNYTPPLNSDGTSMANSSFAAAPVNGFDTNSVTVALSGQFYYVYGNGGTQTALGYTYANGAVDATTTFYQECNVTTVASPPPATLGKFTKVTLTNASAAAAKQNYANWFSYYRTRLLMMKTLAGQAFSALGNQFRIGFSTIHDQQASQTSTFLPINDFNSGAGNQKAQFYSTLYAISANAFAVPQQYTPARGALAKAGRMYAGKFYTAGTFPGGTTAQQVLDPMQYSCQQNFTLLASDGYWNSSDDSTSFGPLQLDNATPVGDQDGVAGTPRPMLDALANPNTLADVAMYYYQTDLRHPGNCTSGATGANLCPVDSTGAYAPNVPGNSTDNNVKPHMTTLTVGLGINGILGYSPSYNTDQTGDFHSLVTGTNGIVWPTTLTNMTPSNVFPYDATVNRQVIQRDDDLWHAAVDGRGTYYNAKNPTTLAQGLKGALAGVANRLGFGNAGATSSLAPVTGNNFLYVASYTTGQWTGNLVRESIDVNTGAVIGINTANGDWCVENIAADAIAGTPECLGKLETQVSKSSDTRNIYFNKTGTLTSFTYANLPAAQQAYFDNTKLSQYPSPSAPPWTTIASGATLVNYLRGQSQYESQNSDGTANLYRVRAAKLGDIVDNQPLYVGAPFYQYADPGYTAWKTAHQSRQKTIFVGSNDGMLHAFNADTGLEMWAFVPTVVMPCMYLLADTSYGTGASSTSPTCLGQTLLHHNYVNGRLTFSDVCFTNCNNSSADWHTLLFGALDGGGRGIYAIDVTDPTTPGKVWEFTSLNDADFGYSFGNPLAAKKSDGTWVVLVSSGIDNVKLNNGDPYDANGTGQGFLFVLNPQTGALISPNGKYGTGVGSKAVAGSPPIPANPSGLGRLAFWADSPEQDATALNVYGGDLFGNLWRFDINKAPPPTDPTSVIQLTTFKDKNGTAQPVTTRPEMTLVSGHRMIFTATGKYLEVSDLTNTQTQSLYAIPDNSGAQIADPRAGAKRTLVNNRPIRTLTADAVDPANGWYVDFPDIGKDSQGNNVGSERNSVDMVLATGTLLVATNVPTNGICDSGGYSWLNFFDYATGEAVTGSGGTVAIFTGNDMTTGLNVVWVGGAPEVIRTGNATPPTRLTGITFAGATAGVVGHRVGWREIITP